MKKIKTFFPERLLRQRYALLSDIWGARRKIGRLKKETEEQNLKLVKVTKQINKVQNIMGNFSKEWKRYESIETIIKDNIYIIHILENTISRKLDQLKKTEYELRKTFQSVGRSQWLKSIIPSIPEIKSQKDNKYNKKYSYDLFISYASEDESDIVNPLVKLLEEIGLRVWYDKTYVKVGDSLRRSIDNGLINSRFGVVIISPNFIKKSWTLYELDSLVAREITAGKVILPIWHRVSKNDVQEFSPKLSDKVALHTSILTIEEIALNIALVVEDQKN